MSEDIRTQRNYHDSPEMGDVAAAPDHIHETGPQTLLDAWDGLIQQTERMFLFGLLQSMSQPYIRAVEIGTWKGTTMHVLRRACDELYCIDPEPQWYEDPNIKTRSGHSVKLLKGYSPQVLREIPAPFTFVFVDGDHCTEGVLRDGLALESLMEVGGVIAFHDAHHEPCAAGIIQTVQQWKRPHQFIQYACDTISTTPLGNFGGISLIIVEPENFQGNCEPASFFRGFRQPEA